MFFLPRVDKSQVRGATPYFSLTYFISVYYILLYNKFPTS